MIIELLVTYWWVVLIVIVLYVIKNGVSSEKKRFANNLYSTAINTETEPVDLMWLVMLYEKTNYVSSENIFSSFSIFYANIRNGKISVRNSGDKLVKQYIQYFVVLYGKDQHSQEQLLKLYFPGSLYKELLKIIAMTPSVSAYSTNEAIFNEARYKTDELLKIVTK